MSTFDNNWVPPVLTALCLLFLTMCEINLNWIELKDTIFCQFSAPDRTVQSGDTLEKIRSELTYILNGFILMGTTVVVTVNSGRGISMSACKCSDVYCTGALHDVKNIECAVPRNSGESIQVFFKQQSSTSFYRSRQYYESKVLHNTEVAWF